jgi:hypothetical protein
MKTSDIMPPLAGVKSAKRTGLGRWSAGKGAVEAWRFAAAPFHLPVFFPLRTADVPASPATAPLREGVQMDLSL